MTNNTIANVPRQLLERAATSIEQRMCIQCEGVPCCMPESLNTLSDIRALLSAPSPAGVDGLEVVGWYTDDHLDDKSATTYSREVADRWLAKGWPVTGIANESAAQAIIDGLRGEVADLGSMLATVSKAGIRVRTERDQQAQRIGELEGLLRSCLPALSDGGCAALANRIDAALSAVCGAAPNIAPTSEHSGS